MTDNTYNGWTNYATWRVNLEIFDCLSVEDVFTADLEDPSPWDVGDAMKVYVEDIILEQAPEGLARDYALAFLADVNWYEIASHKLEECQA